MIVLILTGYCWAKQLATKENKSIISIWARFCLIISFKITQKFMPYSKAPMNSLVTFSVADIFFLFMIVRFNERLCLFPILYPDPARIFIILFAASPLLNDLLYETEMVVFKVLSNHILLNEIDGPRIVFLNSGILLRLILNEKAAVNAAGMFV